MILGATAAALVVAAVLTALQTPVYESTTTVRLVTRPSDLTTGIGVDAIAYEDRVANTYRQILEGDGTRDWLAGRLGVSDAPGVRVTLPANSQLVTITASATEPARARAAADLLADRLATTVAVPGTVVLVEPPAEPSSPASPSWWTNLGLAGLAGLLGGVGLAFLFERRDTRLRGAAQIEDVSRVPVLAEIPRGAVTGPAIVNSGSAQEEAFRGLQTMIVASERARPLRSILFTSIEPGPATATVLANVATATARAGRSVVAVDADLREPALHSLFRVANTNGLTTVLRGSRDTDAVLREPRSFGVSLMTAGRPISNPGNALASPLMAQIIGELQGRFDSVLVCSHSILGAADAGVLARLVDGVVLVVPRGTVHEEELRQAVRELDLLDARPIGLVLVDEGRAGTLAGRLRPSGSEGRPA